jgi:hypothetical protein
MKHSANYGGFTDDGRKIYAVGFEKKSVVHARGRRSEENGVGKLAALAVFAVFCAVVGVIIAVVAVTGVLNSDKPLVAAEKGNYIDNDTGRARMSADFTHLPSKYGIPELAADRVRDWFAVYYSVMLTGEYPKPYSIKQFYTTGSDSAATDTLLAAGISSAYKSAGVLSSGAEISLEIADTAVYSEVSGGEYIRFSVSASFFADNAHINDTVHDFCLLNTGKTGWLIYTHKLQR